MILVLSGEGATDLGACTNGHGRCDGTEFAVGPITVLIDQMLEQKLGYSVLDFPACLNFFDESYLCRKAKELPARMQPARSKKKEAETGYFFGNAVALGTLAQEIEQSTEDKAVVAILLRDYDSTRSANAHLWQTKHKSMEDGFRYARFDRGVPMLPKPTSEAWLLCQAQENPYQNCSRLEDLPGNQSSPNHPKKELDKAFGSHKNAAELCDWLRENPIDLDRASSMPSFRYFRERLNTVLDQVVAA